MWDKYMHVYNRYSVNISLKIFCIDYVWMIAATDCDVKRFITCDHPILHLGKELVMFDFDNISIDK